MTIVMRAAAVLAVVLFGLLMTAPVTSAHAQLESSDPADGAQLTAAPERVTLVFSEAVDAGFAQITVLGPDGRSRWEAGTVRAHGDRVSAPLRELGPAGRYVIKYRVLSVDGHPVSGTVGVQLTKAGGGTPAAGGAATGPSRPAETGVPLWVWIGGVVVLFGAGIFTAGFVTRAPR